MAVKVAVPLSPELFCGFNWTVTVSAALAGTSAKSAPSTATTSASENRFIPEPLSIRGREAHRLRLPPSSSHAGTTPHTLNPLLPYADVSDLDDGRAQGDETMRGRLGGLS